MEHWGMYTWRMIYTRLFADIVNSTEMTHKTMNDDFRNFNYAKEWSYYFGFEETVSSILRKRDRKLELE